MIFFFPYKLIRKSLHVMFHVFVPVLKRVDVLSTSSHHPAYKNEMTDIEIMEYSFT